MNIQLHQNARTTPARNGANGSASHPPPAAPDHPQCGPQEAVVVVALRETLLLPLDDLLAVTREQSLALGSGSLSAPPRGF